MERQVITSFEREEQSNSKLSIVRIAIGRRGERERDSGRIRQRLLVIGLSDLQLAIVYPKGSETTTEGYHTDLEAEAYRYFLGNTRAILHGSIGKEITGTDSLHVIKIYKMHKDDIKTLGGIETIEIGHKERGTLWEMGKVTPERFIDNNLAQNLLHNLDASRLDIVEGQPSAYSYNVNGALVRNPHTRIVRDGD